MKQYWRYVIARYGAYPILWSLSDDLADPPPALANRIRQDLQAQFLLPTPPGTEIIRYVGSTEPCHHPLTVNEAGLPAALRLSAAGATG